MFLPHKNQHSCSKWVPTLVTCLVSMSILHHVSDSVGTSASRTLNSSEFKDATGTCFVCSIFWLEPTTMYTVWLRISGVTSIGWMWTVRLYENNVCLKDKWHQKWIYFLNKRIFSSLLEVTLSIRALTRLQWQASNSLFIFTSNIFTQARTEKFSLSAMIFWGVVDFFHLAKETKTNIVKKNNKIWVWKKKKKKKENHTSWSR